MSVDLFIIQAVAVCSTVSASFQPAAETSEALKLVSPAEILGQSWTNEQTRDIPFSQLWNFPN